MFNGNFLCLSCQRGGFVPREWLATKGLFNKHHIALYGPGGGRETSYNGLNGEVPLERGTFFRLQVYVKGGESCHFGIYYVLKGLQKDFMAVKKSRKFSGFAIYSYFKDDAFTALNRDASSKLGIWKGYHLSIEGIRKGYVFCQKRYVKG